MALDEHEAITRMKAGDIGGLEMLVRAHQVRAVQAAYLITHDRALAEDIVQSAFIRAYERIDQFDDRRAFGPWFYRSVANDAMKAVTRQRRFHPFPGSSPDRPDEQFEFVDEVPDSSLDPEARLLQAESDDEVRVALKHLPPQQRAAIIMRYFLDLPEHEIAERLGVPAGTAKSRLHVARGRLRGMLKGGRTRDHQTGPVADDGLPAIPYQGGSEEGSVRR